MSLLSDILRWTQTLPAWQSDAARRLLQCEEGLSEHDYAELYTLLKADHGLPNPGLKGSDPFNLDKVLRTSPLRKALVFFRSINE